MNKDDVKFADRVMACLDRGNDGEYRKGALDMLQELKPGMARVLLEIS